MSAIPLTSEYVLVPIAEEEEGEPEVQLVSVKIGDSVPWTPAETRTCIFRSVGLVVGLASLTVIVYTWYVLVTKYG